MNNGLLHKGSVGAPPQILVERYLIEIAKNCSEPCEPDSVVMVEAPPGVETEQRPQFALLSNGYRAAYRAAMSLK